ncbi:GntR family transcriptional regulator [Nesterenkonia aurantiaca]|uniref:GntR family transcriptional regulator n=1 Tax=Nesterenkonia aurantiaca TaxID=1436010 RepID=UPI003EE7E637
MTSRELREIYQARFVIESDAIQKICRRHKGAPPGMAQLLDDMEEAGRQGQWRSFAQMDQALHLSLVRHQGNSVLAEMYESLGPRHTRLAVRTLVEATWRLDLIEKEHRSLIAALENHDPEEGIAVLRRHLQEIPEIIETFND